MSSSSSPSTLRRYMRKWLKRRTRRPRRVKLADGRQTLSCMSSCRPQYKYHYLMERDSIPVRVLLFSAPSDLFADRSSTCKPTSKRGTGPDPITDLPITILRTLISADLSGTSGNETGVLYRITCQNTVIFGPLMHAVSGFLKPSPTPHVRRRLHKLNA
jgi:hypothetical protein